MPSEGAHRSKWCLLSEACVGRHDSRHRARAHCFHASRKSRFGIRSACNGRFVPCTTCCKTDSGAVCPSMGRTFP